MIKGHGKRFLSSVVTDGKDGKLENNGPIFSSFDAVFKNLQKLIMVSSPCSTVVTV